ncbi:MAG TPA: ABC transporter ATP-binding protein [Thermomicrobiaceae bacterium]|nr:ABC transporter ATP-binding protein [Thermomicrobiaceae bacterium]
MTVAATTQSVVTASALQKRYGSIVALDSLDIEIPRTSVGLLGPNGAGKSTLIKLLLGLIRPSGGSASIFGLDATRDALRVRERVGYMPESDCLPGDVTAADFVGHMAQMSGLPPREARLRAAETLYLCGVDEERYRLMREFSTGMKQRVKLAQAIVHDPELVLLDEPTNGMDPQGREDMLHLIQRIHHTAGIAVLLSSHLLPDVERVCEYVVMLDHGRLVQHGAVASLVQGSSDIDVQIDGDAEVFSSRLAAAGMNIHRNGPDLVVQASDDVAFDIIRDTAVDLGVALRKLQPSSRSLEDVYVQQLRLSESQSRENGVDAG